VHAYVMYSIATNSNMRLEGAKTRTK